MITRNPKNHLLTETLIYELVKAFALLGFKLANGRSSDLLEKP